MEKIHRHWEGDVGGHLGHDLPVPVLQGRYAARQVECRIYVRLVEHILVPDVIHSIEGGRASLSIRRNAIYVKLVSAASTPS